MPLPQRISVWLIEDHADCRRMVARVINATRSLSCPHAFSTCEDALAQLAAGPVPQVILIDLGLPRMSGLDGIARIKAISPGTHVVVLTVYDDHEKVFKAICAGASGYLLKTADDDAITSAIQEVLNGGAPMSPRVARLVLNMFTKLSSPAPNYGLSPREKQILELMVKGLIKKEIADQLGLSYHTVDNHLRNIYTKLHVNTRGGAVAKAVKEGVVG